MRAAARVAASSGWPSSASRGAADRNTLEFSGAAPYHQGEAVDADELRGQWPQAAAQGVPDSVEGHRVPAVPLRRPPVHVADRARVGDPGPQHVRDQPVQPVPATARAHGMHEQVRRGQLGQGRRTGPRAGQRVGQVGGHEVDETDPHQEVQQLRSLPVDHLGQQVGGHRVVVAGERIDEPGGIRAALQLRGRPTADRPPTPRSARPGDRRARRRGRPRAGPTTPPSRPPGKRDRRPGPQ